MCNEEFTLAELFDMETKPELLRTAKHLNIKVKSTLRKAEIVEILTNTILQTPTYLLERLSWCDVLRLQTMVHADKHGVLIHKFVMQLDSLSLIGITDNIPVDDILNSGLEVIFPDVITALSPVIDEFVVANEKNGKYEREQLIVGLLNLYGVLTIEELRKLYFTYYPNEMILDLLEIMTGSYLLTRLSGASFLVFASPFLEDFESDLVDLAYMNHYLIHQRKSIRQAKFTKEEVIAAGISEFPMPPVNNREKVDSAFKQLGISKEESDKWISYMWMSSNEDKKIGEIIKLIFEDLMSCSMEDLQSIVGVLMELMNCLPRWILKGNTPEVVHEKYERPKMQKQPPQLVVGPNMKKAGIDISQERFNDLWKDSAVQFTSKVGRNDPCPCGSGKKYKYCCGSN